MQKIDRCINEVLKVVEVIEFMTPYFDADCYLFPLEDWLQYPIYFQHLLGKGGYPYPRRCCRICGTSLQSSRGKR